MLQKVAGNKDRRKLKCRPTRPPPPLRDMVLKTKVAGSSGTQLQTEMKGHATHRLRNYSFALLNAELLDKQLTKIT